MSVLINFKICDKSPDCSGIAVCPTDALYWDNENKMIGIDNSKCTSCDLCEKACMVHAIHVAKTDKEYERIKKEIDADPRKASDLFVDKYGAEPVDPAFILAQENFDFEILQSTKPAIVELFNDDSIECLLESIPVKNLIGHFDIRYRKIGIDDKVLLERYSVKELPALLFFKDGELIGKIEGYFDIKRKNELIEKINEIKL